ncbi:hypothetical protein PHLGIDRAFT_14352 [Phlebiopsis gigantea 11061_1 CR5-6]|uniref:Uncharacterized protein n=1 Tax=Phlebiopsis gigantea (strain 11061_1 CR5-6) TaxID=745531 RepID=A0A0C3S8Y6_PHLG1|nr:hypothetical protein PHLGIDRAFT_14352 [Phlebiopsis gigantea 11061_1 CR5-6]
MSARGQSFALPASDDESSSSDSDIDGDGSGAGRQRRHQAEIALPAGSSSLNITQVQEALHTLQLQCELDQRLLQEQAREMACNRLGSDRRPVVAAQITVSTTSQAQAATQPSYTISAASSASAGAGTRTIPPNDNAPYGPYARRFAVLVFPFLKADDFTRSFSEITHDGSARYLSDEHREHGITADIYYHFPTSCHEGLRSGHRAIMSHILDAMSGARSQAVNAVKDARNAIFDTLPPDVRALISQKNWDDPRLSGFLRGNAVNADDYSRPFALLLYSPTHQGDIRGLYQAPWLFKLAAVLLWGASANDVDRSSAPPSNCNGVKWKVTDITPGFIAFCCILACFLLGPNKSFGQIGSTTKTDYKAAHAFYRDNLGKNLQTNKKWALKVIKVWKEQVLRPIGGGPLPSASRSRGVHAEAADADAVLMQQMEEDISSEDELDALGLQPTSKDHPLPTASTPGVTMAAVPREVPPTANRPNNSMFNANSHVLASIAAEESDLADLQVALARPPSPILVADASGNPVHILPKATSAPADSPESEGPVAKRVTRSRGAGARESTKSGNKPSKKKNLFLHAIVCFGDASRLPSSAAMLFGPIATLALLLSLICMTMQPPPLPLSLSRIFACRHAPRKQPLAHYLPVPHFPQPVVLVVVLCFAYGRPLHILELDVGTGIIKLTAGGVLAAYAIPPQMFWTLRVSVHPLDWVDLATDMPLTTPSDHPFGLVLGADIIYGLDLRAQTRA